MILRYDPDLLKQLKKQKVRVRKSFKQKLEIFIKDSLNPQLNNHTLKGKFSGYRNIDVTNDYRVIYKEKVEEDGLIAYFIAIGTHEELYRGD